MDEKQGSQSPSLDDNEWPSKRQKLDTSNSSNVNTSGNDLSVLDSERDSARMKCEFEILRKKLDQAEATTIQYHKIQMQTKELFEQEMNVLEMQVQLDKETIVKLQEDLKTSMRRAQESQEAQAAAHAKLSQLKTIIEQEITPLTMNSSSEHTVTVSQAQKHRQQMEEKIMEMEKTLDNDSTSQKELNPETIQLQRAKQYRKSLKAKAKRADKLEEQLKIAEDTISSLHGALSEQESSMQEKWDEAEKLQQQVNMLQASSSGGCDNKTQDNNDTSTDQPHDEDSSSESAEANEKSPSAEGQSDADEGSLIPEDEEQPKYDLRMLIGNKYPFLASPPQFDEIDWNEEFSKTKTSNFVCTTCSLSLKSRVRIQDHVWTAHYKGKFECLLCTDTPMSFLWRRSLQRHISEKHKEP